MSNVSYSQAISSAVDVVEWQEDELFDEPSGHKDTPENNRVVALLQRMFPNEANNVENDLANAVVDRKNEPDPDAELKEHLEYEQQQELNKPTP